MENPNTTNAADDAALLKKINEAVAAANEAEKTAETAKAELVSRSKVVGTLLLEARKRQPTVKDFEAFLKRVDGLQLSRAYDLMRLAGGRTTDEEIRKATRDRVKKHRASKKKLPQPAPKKKPEPEEPEPEPISVTSTPVTETAEASAYADFLNATEKAAKESAHALAEFTFACRQWLPKMVEADRHKARALVHKLTSSKPKAEAA
jgi:hypothetical protein